MLGRFRFALELHRFLLVLWIVAGDRDLIVGRAFCGRSVLNDHAQARVRRDRMGATIAEDREWRIVFRRADVDVQIAGTIIADREARACGRIRSRLEVQGTRRHPYLGRRSRCRRWSCRSRRGRSGGLGGGSSRGGGGGNGWRCGRSRSPSRRSSRSGSLG